MGGKIDAYLDCVSPYSYFAFLHLQEKSAVLKDYGVDIEFHPVFLGGINVGSGNKPPWTLPAKAKYSSFDLERAKKHFGATKVKRPDFFPILSLLPQRCMLVIKARVSKNRYEAAFKELWIAMWEQGQDLSKPPIMKEVLMRHFTADEADGILKSVSDPAVKQQLNDETLAVVERGAFGCPWFFVTDAQGKTEPFFGSDRFSFMWQYLGLDWQNVAVKPASKL